MKPAKRNFDTFFTAYLECALWSSTDDDGNPMDNYTADDVETDTLATMELECRQFLEMADKYLNGDYSQAGHDFWLTRNGHGAGFWDGDWGKDGDKLTTMAKSFGSVNLYVGDDNKIYQG